MCGRYATTRGSAELSALFEASDETGEALTPAYNVAPTRFVPVVRICPDRSERVLDRARWGLVPPWATDLRIGARMINARVETVATSRAFAPSFARRRCLIPADGWYEWTRQELPTGQMIKQPYFMTSRDGAPVVFAGLWSVWRKGPESLVTCTILTTGAIGDLASVHHRMPLLLPRWRWGDWLTDGSEPAGLLAPPLEKDLDGIEIRRVGRAVGDVRNDSPQLIAPVAGGGPDLPPEFHAQLTFF
jgi:putative SOS response-associated peptidase YedK